MIPDTDNIHLDKALNNLPLELVDALNVSRQRRVSINRGRSIITVGQSMTAIFLISEGWAVSRLSIDTGDTQILDILGPGSFVGMSHLAATNFEQYSAISLQDIQAYRIEADELRRICSENPVLSRWLFNELSRHSQRTQRHITALGQLPARGRLAFIMLRIIDVAQQNGDIAVNKTIRLPMTQEEIGNMLGLTNVSISKLMSAFRKEGLIDYGRNRIVVHDVKALSKICGMDVEENYGSAGRSSAEKRPMIAAPLSNRSAR